MFFTFIEGGDSRVELIELSLQGTECAQGGGCRLAGFGVIGAGVERSANQLDSVELGVQRLLDLAGRLLPPRLSEQLRGALLAASVLEAPAHHQPSR